MKKRNAVLAIIAVASMLAAVPFVYAGPGGHRGPGAHGGRGGHGGPGGMALFGNLKHVQEELDLSDAQVEQIRGIFVGLRQENEAYREQLKGGFHGIAEALLKNPNDLSAAQALLDQQASAERAMKANMLAATSKALNVLTAAQRTELAEMIAERRERRSERRNRR